MLLLSNGGENACTSHLSRGCHTKRFNSCLVATFDELVNLPRVPNILQGPSSHQYLWLLTLGFLSSVQSFSRVRLFATLRTHARLPCPSPTPEVCSNSYRVSDAIQSSHPLLSPSPPVFNLSQHQGLFQ